MTPAVPFIDEVISFLVVPLNIISIILAGSLIHHYYTFSLELLITSLMLCATHTKVNCYANLHVFIITYVLSHPRFKIFPTSFIPPCKMSIVNLHAYSFFDCSSISIISLYEIFSFDRREYSSLANVTFSGLYGFINLFCILCYLY
jgi:hypothetical protein